MGAIPNANAGVEAPKFPRVDIVRVAMLELQLGFFGVRVAASRKSKYT